MRTSSAVCPDRRSSSPYFFFPSNSPSTRELRPAEVAPTHEPPVSAEDLVLRLRPGQAGQVQDHATVRLARTLTSRVQERDRPTGSTRSRCVRPDEPAPARSSYGPPGRVPHHPPPRPGPAAAYDRDRRPCGPGSSRGARTSRPRRRRVARRHAPAPAGASAHRPRGPASRGSGPGARSRPGGVHDRRRGVADHRRRVAMRHRGLEQSKVRGGGLQRTVVGIGVRAASNPDELTGPHHSGQLVGAETVGREVAARCDG